MVPAGRADPGHRRQARQAARQGRPDRRRRQLEVDRRPAPAPPAAQAGHPLRRRGHERRRLGPRGRLLHDGRRARRGGRSARPHPRRPRPAARRRARTGLGAHGPQRRGPLREDGPQRRRVRADAGLRRGLRPLRQVRLRPGQREDRPPVDARLGRALVAVRAGGEGLRAGGQRPRGPERLHRGLRRGALDDRGRDGQGRPDAGHHGLALRALLHARPTATSPAASCPRCAPSSAATRRRSPPTDERRGGGPDRPG